MANNRILNTLLTNVSKKDAVVLLHDVGPLLSGNNTLSVTPFIWLDVEKNKIPMHARETSKGITADRSLGDGPLLTSVPSQSPRRSARVKGKQPSNDPELVRAGPIEMVSKRQQKVGSRDVVVRELFEKSEEARSIEADRYDDEPQESEELLNRTEESFKVEDVTVKKESDVSEVSDQHDTSHTGWHGPNNTVKNDDNLKDDVKDEKILKIAEQYSTAEVTAKRESGSSRICQDGLGSRDISQVVLRKRKGHCLNSPLKCRLCAKAFPKKAYLRRHVFSHNKADYFPCLLCDESGTCRPWFVEHWRKTHGEKEKAQRVSDTFSCTKCGKMYSSMHSLRSHKRKKHSKQNSLCKNCGVTFPSHMEKKQHKSFCHKREKHKKLISCNVCGKSVSSAQDHLNMHAGVRPYLCRECGKDFLRKHGLERHTQTVHSGGVRPFVCETCGNSYRAVSYLRVHQRKHTNEKPYKCQKCGAKFRLYIALQDHRRTHNGERPYKCKECPKAYKTFSQLKTHIKMHSSIKEHKCLICKSKFRLPHQLRAHVARMHETLSQLKTHANFAKMHSSIKGHKCVICKSKFRLPHELRAHVARKHTAEDY